MGGQRAKRCRPRRVRGGCCGLGAQGFQEVISGEYPLWARWSRKIVGPTLLLALRAKPLAFAPVLPSGSELMIELPHATAAAEYNNQSNE